MLKKIIISFVGLLTFIFSTSLYAVDEMELTSPEDTTRDYNAHWHRGSGPSHPPENKILEIRFDKKSGCDQVFMIDQTSLKEVRLTQSCNTFGPQPIGDKSDSAWGIYMDDLTYVPYSPITLSSTPPTATIKDTWIVLYSREMMDGGRNIFAKPIGSSLKASDVKAFVTANPDEIQLTFASKVYDPASGKIAGIDRHPQMNFIDTTGGKNREIVFVREKAIFNYKSSAYGPHDMIYVIKTAWSDFTPPSLAEHNVTIRYSGVCGSNLTEIDANDPQWVGGYNIVFKFLEGTIGGGGAHLSPYPDRWQLATVYKSETISDGVYGTGNDDHYAACGDLAGTGGGTAEETSFRMVTDTDLDHHRPMPTWGGKANGVIYTKTGTNANEQYGIIYTVKIGGTGLAAITVLKDLDSIVYRNQLISWSTEYLVSPPVPGISRRAPVFAPYPLAPVDLATSPASSDYPILFTAYERKDPGPNGPWQIYGTQMVLEPIITTVAEGGAFPMTGPITTTMTKFDASVLASAASAGTGVFDIKEKEELRLTPVGPNVEKIILEHAGVAVSLYSLESKKAPNLAEQMAEDFKAKPENYYKAVVDLGGGDYVTLVTIKSLQDVLSNPMEGQDGTILMLNGDYVKPSSSLKIPNSGFSLISNAMAVSIVSPASAKLFKPVYPTKNERRWTDCPFNNYFPEFAEKLMFKKSGVVPAPTDVVHVRQRDISIDIDHPLVHLTSLPTAVVPGNCLTCEILYGTGWITHDPAIPMGIDLDSDSLADQCDPCLSTPPFLVMSGDAPDMTPAGAGYDFDNDSDGTNEACGRMLDDPCTDHYPLVDSSYDLKIDTDDDLVADACDWCPDYKAYWAELPYDTDDDGVGDSCWPDDTACSDDGCCGCCSGDITVTAIAEVGDITVTGGDTTITITGDTSSDTSGTTTEVAPPSETSSPVADEAPADEAACEDAGGSWSLSNGECTGYQMIGGCSCNDLTGGKARMSWSYFVLVVMMSLVIGLPYVVMRKRVVRSR